MALGLVGACAPPLRRLPVTPSDRLIPAPRASVRLDPVLLGHLLRGLEHLAAGRPAAAVPHLRLALLYDPDSAFIYERLAFAWSASGEVAHARATLAEGLAKAPAAPRLNLLAGEFAAADGTFAAAVDHLERAIEVPQFVGRAGALLVDALLSQGDRRRALRRAAELAMRAPPEAGFVGGVAAALEDHGELDESLAWYRRAREQRPSDEAAAFGEGRVLGLRGAFGAAVEALVPLLRFYPDDVSLFIEITRLLRRAGSVDAEAYRQEALRQAGTDPEARLRIAMGDLVAGAHAAGVTLLREILQAAPDYVGARLVLASWVALAGEASGCLSTLADAPATDAGVHRLQVECAVAAGEIDRALSAAARAIRLGSGRDELVAATLALVRHSPDEATAAGWRDALVERVRDGLDDADLDLSRVVLADFFGHGREALTLIRRLKDEKGMADDPDWALRWADLEARFGSFDTAVDTLQSLLRRAPQNVIFLNALGFTLADAGVRLDEAEVLLRRAYRLAPDQGFIADSLGWLLYRRRDFAGAVALLEQADAEAPGDPEILRHLGDAYAALGRAPEARACYERALARRPMAPLRTLLEAQLRKQP